MPIALLIARATHYSSTLPRVNALHALRAFNRVSDQAVSFGDGIRYARFPDNYFHLEPGEEKTIDIIESEVATLLPWRFP